MRGDAPGDELFQQLWLGWGDGHGMALVAKKIEGMLYKSPAAQG